MHSFKHRLLVHFVDYFPAGKWYRMVLDVGCFLKKKNSARGRNMTVTYRGETYQTIKSLAEAYQVDYAHLRKLLKEKWPVEDAMKICRDRIPGKGRLYEYKGKYYRSPKLLAEENGLPWNSLSHFLVRCDSVEEAVQRCREQQENRVILWGREYQSRYELAEMFGLSYASISYGMNCKKMSLEEAVQELLKREPIQFEGQTYQTIVELCANYQVQPCNVMERLSQGKTLYEAVYQPVRNNGKVNEMEYEGRIFQNAAILCREYYISKILVAGQKRYAEGKSFLECFRLVKQLRDESGWPKDQMFSFIPRCKIEGVFYKKLSDFSRTIGMTDAPITTYKSKHNCYDLIETLQKMQKDRIPAYRTEYGLLTYTQAWKMHYSYEEIKALPYIKEGIPRYPKLQEFDFERDSMDILRRCEELFGRKPKSRKREAGR